MRKTKSRLRAKRVSRRVPRRIAKAIVHIPAVVNRPWDLNREEVELVKKQICPGATDEELKFCLTVAKRNRLDPFKGQIWFVPRGKGADKKWVPIVGINGLRHIAARDHRDYGSVGEPEFGPMITVNWTKYDDRGNATPKTLNVPEWARVLIYKKGCAVPSVGKVYWEEIYKNIDNAPLVRQMPRLMLGKCAEAQGQRKAYPGTDGLYIQEEFAAARPEYTKEGREIIYPDEPTYTGKLDENAKHGHPAGSEKAQQAEAQLAKVEAEDAKYKANKEFASSSNPAYGTAREGATASNRTQSGQPGGTAVPPEAAVKPSPKPPVSPKQAPKSTVAATGSLQGKRSPDPGSGIAVPQARIPHKITSAKWTPNSKGVEIELDTGHRMYCFHDSKMDEKGAKLFDLLINAVGKMIIATTHMEKNFFHIDKVLQLGDREWDEEGIPVLRRESPDEYKGREF